MDKFAIISSIRETGYAEIAVLQQKFNLPYKEAKAVVDELVGNGSLIYEAGVKYTYVNKSDQELDKCRAEAMRAIKGDNSARHDLSEEEKMQVERRAYLEMRRRELIKKMQEEMREDAASDDDDDIDENEESEIDDETLQFKALKLIIEKNVASVSLFQRSFPIGYIRSCKLIDWMESQGYISVAEGFTPRKVLITKEEFDELYSERNLIEIGSFDDDTDEGEDDGFDMYEKFLNEHLSDCSDDDEREEVESYDRVINRLFNPSESNPSETEASERKTSINNLVTVLHRVVDKKKEPVTAKRMPAHPSWINEKDFTQAVMKRLELLIKSDNRMGQKGAVKKAETWLEAVRDTRDAAMVEVYERLVFEIKNTSCYMYGQLKKQYFGE